ncbi:MAG: hypothetical protein K9J81_09785 [Desulfohalobiaceae bacterium]|nr:hypothetical protein [Desulfohalobiaceae bacterium]
MFAIFVPCPACTGHHPDVSGRFPEKPLSRLIITIHWITAILLAPLGTYSIPFAIAAWCCYCFILYMMLFSKGTRNTPLT